MGVWWSKGNNEGDDDDDDKVGAGAGEEEEEDAVYTEAQISYQLVQTEIALRRTAPRGSLRVVLLGEKRPLAGSLIAQDNPEVQEVDLLEEFSSVRETRKDRDCFYRSFVFSYMEHIFERQDRREVDRMLAILRKYAIRNKVLAGYVMHFPDFFKDFHKLLSTYSKGKRSVERRQDLLVKFQHEDSAATIVLLIRLITAIEIHMWRTSYPDDILGEKYSNLVEFCTGEVFPIGNKHVHAAVLSNALGVPIRVVDLTPAPPSSSESSTEDFPYYAAANTGSSSASSPTATRKRARFQITLLYRPDNCYDILYPISDEVICCGYPIPDDFICCGLGAVCLSAFPNSS